MSRISLAVAMALATFAAGAISAQEPRPKGPLPADRADIRSAQEPAAPGTSALPRGPRPPADLRGRGTLPPDDPPPRRGPDEPGRGGGRRPLGPDMRGGLRPAGPGMGPGPFEMQRLEQDDPEMYQLFVEDNRLDREALALARRIRQAKSPEREKLQSDLAVLVNKHFDVRQQRRELSLKRMEEELKRLREAIESRSKGREDIVQKRIAELVGDDSGLEF